MLCMLHRTTLEELKCTFTVFLMDHLKYTFYRANGVWTFVGLFFHWHYAFKISIVIKRISMHALKIWSFDVYISSVMQTSFLRILPMLHYHKWEDWSLSFSATWSGSPESASRIIHTVRSLTVETSAFIEGPGIAIDFGRLLAWIPMPQRQFVVMKDMYAV